MKKYSRCADNDIAKKIDISLFAVGAATAWYTAKISAKLLQTFNENILCIYRLHTRLISDIVYYCENNFADRTLSSGVFYVKSVLFFIDFNVPRHVYLVCRGVAALRAQIKRRVTERHHTRQSIGAPRRVSDASQSKCDEARDIFTEQE